ncbi:MAG: arylesterase [Desulfuromonadales bacterium]|nr:arylesterase [Desulfuromonadales bacterium]
MKIFRQIRLIVLLLTSLIASGCDSTPPITRLHSDAVIIAFGDSLTYGTGAEKNQAYPAVLSQLLGKQVINAGIPGEVSAEGLKRLPAVLEEHQPDLVILCHGGNDFLRRLDREQTAANLAAMVEMIQARGADVILLGVPQFGLILKPAELYETIAAQHRIPYQADIISDLLGKRSLKSDQIHPNGAGYRQLAEAVHRLIRKAEGS